MGTSTKATGVLQVGPMDMNGTLTASATGYEFKTIHKQKFSLC